MISAGKDVRDTGRLYPEQLGEVGGLQVFGSHDVSDSVFHGILIFLFFGPIDFTKVKILFLQKTKFCN